jgi:cytochrome c oxidase assembly factor CtaG
MLALIGLVVAAALWGLAGAASAHGGGYQAAPPGWTLDPWITFPLALTLGLYTLGWLRLRARAARGAGPLKRRAALFAAGMLMLGLALVSPLHQAGERSFTAHMAEHEILMLVAAPLLVLSRPSGVMLWAFPAVGRRGLGRLGRWPPLHASWRALTQPITATLLQAAALWTWHAPTLFDLALAHSGWHVAQHLWFLVTALLFWSAMLHPRDRPPGTLGPEPLCLFATSVVSGFLGAFMALSQSPWYAGYARLGMAPFGLTPAEDQQLAGLLMWIPGGLVHAAAALVILGLSLRKGARPAHAL